MYKTIAAVIVSAFAFGATTSFAADVAKKSEELTVEQRAEMRERAARLKAQGAQPPQCAPRTKSNTRARPHCTTRNTASPTSTRRKSLRNAADVKRSVRRKRKASR
jgi:hypothetical protein